MNKTILFDNTKYSSVKDVKQSLLKIIYWVLRIFTVLMFFFSFIADFNPAKISDIAAYRNISLFTSAISFSKLTDEFLLGLDNHFVEYSTFIILRVSALIIILGILAIAIGGIISLGDKRKQKTASIFSLSGSIGMGLGIIGIYIAYLQFSNPNIPAQDLQFALDYLKPSFPWALILFMVFAIVFLALSITAFILVRLDKEDVVESVRKNIKLEQKYVLFFYAAPIVLLTFLFSYLPLYGWRYAFFNYESGGTLSFDNFVAFKWFSYLFENPQTVKNLLRASRPTISSFVLT